MKRFLLIVIFIVIAGNIFAGEKGGENRKIYRSLKEALKEPDKVFNLDLSSQHLHTLPKEIGMLKNLKYLYLDNNKLSELSREIGMREKLKGLSLYNNKISKKNIELIKQLFKNNTVQTRHDYE